MDSVNTITEEEIEERAERKKAIEKKLENKKIFGLIKNIEFKRVIMTISGELVNADLTKKYGARFVTLARKRMFYPAHFDMDGNKFTLSMNLMCSNNEEPILTGDYSLVFFERYENDRQEILYTGENPSVENVRRGDTVYKIEYDEKGFVKKKTELTREYPCIIDSEYSGFCSGANSNPWNFKIKRGNNNYFYLESHCDMDTTEYFLKVNYKPPALPPTFKEKTAEFWKKRLDNLKKRFYAFNRWGFVTLFNFFKKFAKENGNIILFASGSRAEIGGNEGFIYKRMLERGLDKVYKFRFDFKESITTSRSTWKMIRFSYYLATSDVIIIDDYYPEIYKVDYSEHTKILQVWHACGAFKSLGFERLGKSGAPPFNTRVHKCYTHVPVSSYHSAKHHAEGFAIDESKFYPVGIPRTDVFFDEEYKRQTKERMYEEFKPCRNAKTVYLYAPTFRGNNAKDASFPFDKINLDRMGEFLEKTDSVMIVKMHPFVKKRIEIPKKYKDRILDAADYGEVNDILFIIDVLITDYSSIIYETSLLKKPMLFYAFDLKHYVSTRDFYEPYEDIVPGKIVTDFDDLMKALEQKDYDYHKMDAFIKKNFTYLDGKATDRVIDQLIIGIEPKD